MSRNLIAQYRWLANATKGKAKLGITRAGNQSENWRNYSVQKLYLDFIFETWIFCVMRNSQFAWFVPDRLEVSDSDW